MAVSLAGEVVSAGVGAVVLLPEGLDPQQEVVLVMRDLSHAVRGSGQHYSVLHPPDLEVNVWGISFTNRESGHGRKFGCRKYGANPSSDLECANKHFAWNNELGDETLLQIRDLSRQLRKHASPKSGGNVSFHFPLFVRASFEI